MPKETDLARCSRPQTHRTYTRQFKAELVAASQQPGASIAAIALQHGMNANVLHRWLKEHALDGRHRLGGQDPLGVAVPTSPVPAFIPLKLPTTRHESAVFDIKVELRKGAVSMTLTWLTPPPTTANR
ncbi:MULTISPECIES: transposase [Burkholderiales]|nr:MULTISPECIES: transposase [Burkholderiales]MDD4942508.1 transposase [Rhodoferax sp.]